MSDLTCFPFSGPIEVRKVSVMKDPLFPGAAARLTACEALGQKRSGELVQTHAFTLGAFNPAGRQARIGWQLPRRG